MPATEEEDILTAEYAEIRGGFGEVGGEEIFGPSSSALRGAPTLLRPSAYAAVRIFLVFFVSPWPAFF